MSILNAIRSKYHRDSHPQETKLQEIRRYLENCLAQECSGGDFFESVVDLAHFKGLDLSTVVDNLRGVSQFLVDFIEILQQIEVQKSQLLKFTDSYFANSEQKSYSLDFANLYLQGFFETLSEQNLFLANSITQYWDYFAEDVQKIVSDSLASEIKLKKELLSHPTLLKSESFLSSYTESVSTLEESFLEVSKNNSSKPKVRLPKANFQSPFKPAKTTSAKSIHGKKKSYTLEELLEGVSLENRHEEVEWGKPVGKEVW